MDEMEIVGSGFESMDLDLLNVSPSNKPKSNSETGAWLNIAMASKGPDSPPNTSKENWMELE